MSRRESTWTDNTAWNQNGTWTTASTVTHSIIVSSMCVTFIDIAWHRRGEEPLTQPSQDPTCCPMHMLSQRQLQSTHYAKTKWNDINWMLPPSVRGQFPNRPLSSTTNIVIVQYWPRRALCYYPAHQIWGWVVPQLVLELRFLHGWRWTQWPNSTRSSNKDRSNLLFTFHSLSWLPLRRQKPGKNKKCINFQVQQRWRYESRREDHRKKFYANTP